MAGFRFSGIQQIQNRFDEVVNEEKEKHGAKHDFSKIPQQRRQQINFIQKTLNSLARIELDRENLINSLIKFELDQENLKKIASGLIRLQKFMIGHKEYKDKKENKENKKESSWWDMVNIFRGDAENSLMYKKNDYILDIDAQNIFDPVTERECFILLKEYLGNIFLNREEKLDPECLSMAKALDFIHEKISILSDTDLKDAQKKLKVVKDSQKYYGIDPIQQMKQASLISADRLFHFGDVNIIPRVVNEDKSKKEINSVAYHKPYVHLNHVTVPKKISMVNRIKQERKELSDEIIAFDKAKLKNVETIEKKPALRMKLFKNPKAYMTAQEIEENSKKAEHKEKRPGTPAVRKKK